jgi:hypothetical protein
MMLYAVRHGLQVLALALVLCMSSEAAAQQYEIFAGFLRDTSGAPLVGKVSINGVEETTYTDGYFEVIVRTDPNQRYLINAHKLGYAPYSVVHTGLAMEEMDIRLKPAEVFTINPSQTINVTDSRGTNISIPPGSMVNAAGQVATGPLYLSLYTWDLRNEQMVGDMTAIDSMGATVALHSLGAFSAEFTDAAGNFYNLMPGRTAAISMPVDPANTYTGPVPLWSFDPARSVWVEEGIGNVSAGVATGAVSHFSAWNFDMKFSDTACIKLTVDSAFFNANLQSDGMFHMRATVRAPFYRSVYMKVDKAAPWKHALYNLAPNVTVETTVFVKNAAGVFEERPYAFVNSGATWGGAGNPGTQNNIELRCKSALHVDSNFKASQLIGRVLREGRTSGHGGTKVQVVGNSGTFNAVTNHDGTFSLLVPAESLTVTASRAHYLSRSKAGLAVTGGTPVQLTETSLPAGDVNNNGTVETSDTMSIITAITNPPTTVSSSDPRDINGNLIIDWGDAQIAVGNGGLASPQPWP